MLDEQVGHFEDEADDARIRALVSETPGAVKEHSETQRHADVMGRARQSLIEKLADLDRQQNDLLDKLGSKN